MIPTQNTNRMAEVWHSPPGLYGLLAIQKLNLINSEEEYQIKQNKTRERVSIFKQVSPKNTGEARLCEWGKELGKGMLLIWNNKILNWYIHNLKHFSHFGTFEGIWS